jgi:predicted RNase H-like HicB family nuclease
MTKARKNELWFEVTEDVDGGYVADRLTESILTQGDTWEELRANVKDAVQGYFYDGDKPEAIPLHLVRHEVLLMQ